MLSERDIAEWAPHARWATSAQVEQDLLITRAVRAIFSDPFLRGQVAMRGGTVLHKVHLAPAARYSEDIDLVAVGKRPGAHINKALERVLAPIMGEGSTDGILMKVLLSLRNAAKPSQILRQSYEYAPNGASGKEAALKVEVNLTERTPVYAVVTLPLSVQLPEGPATFDVVSFDVNEMLGTKMRALLQRDHARDLFDLAHAWATCAAPGHAHPINGELVARAFLEYMKREGTDMTRRRFEDKLNGKLKLARFRADMSDVLADGVKYDVVAAAQIVREHYLVHLP